MAADTGAILAVGLWLVLLFAGLVDLSQGAWDLRDDKQATDYVPEVGRSCIRFVVKLGIQFLLFVVALLALSDAVQLAVRNSRAGSPAESVAATMFLPTRTNHIKIMVRQAAPAPNPVPVISPPAAVGAQPPTRGPLVNPVATTAPPAAGADQNSGTQGNGTPGTTTHPTVTDPTLDRCASALERMLTVLLIELILEVFFVVVRCIVSQIKDLRRALRKWLLVLKIAFAIPVVLINVAILWIGSGPNGACTFDGNTIIGVVVHVTLSHSFSSCGTVPPDLSRERFILTL
jgi:hypothetical protein